MRGRSTFLTGNALFSLLLTGCMQTDSEGPPPPPPAVTVSYPEEQDVQDYNSFTGRMSAVEAVKVRARVWGYLHKIHFTEGALVKKDEVLFEIDPRPYEATLNQAKAAVAQADARLARLELEYQRATKLLSQSAISQEDFDRTLGDRKEAAAAVGSARAARDTALLNLDFTKVRAPIDGQVGRALVTKGNLIESGELGGTLLTTIMSVHPMYCYFDVDDLTFMQVKDLIRAGKLRPVELGLANEKGYPHRGMIDFMDNQVDAGTGTLRMRGKFDNRDGALTPGLFTRIRVPLGDPHKALVITDRAVETDQGQKVVYVVNPDNLVEKHPVQLGKLHGGDREILSGVTARERVVVDGLQRVHEGAPVAPRVAPIPDQTPKSEIQNP
jgi:multidrug efflux system membrane fusion protein